MEKVVSNPAVYLGTLKQRISDTIKGMREAGINESSLNNSLKDALRHVDSVVSDGIKKSLVSKFGNRGWVVIVDTYIVPVMNKGARRSDYRYAIKSISWEHGPSIHEVHYYIAEQFLYYLKSKNYDPAIYNRTIPGIEKRYTSTFLPLPINGKEFRPIEVFISRVVHRINEKQLRQYYQLTVSDPRYKVHQKSLDQRGIETDEVIPMVPDIKGISPETLFLKLQEALEGIFYEKENNPYNRSSNKQLMKNVIQSQQPIVISHEPPGGGGGQPLVRPPSEEKGGGNEEHDEEGQGLSGTDQTDVFDDASIPSEEPNFDTGGLPPTPESIDHNYHDDQNPELEKLADEESGGPSGDGSGKKDPEEAGEDPAEEAAETPEEEAAEEAEEPPESSEAKLAAAAGAGKSISDLMKYDNKQNGQGQKLVINH